MSGNRLIYYIEACRSRRLTTAGLMTAHRLQRWTGISPASFHLLVFGERLRDIAAILHNDGNPHL